MSYASRSWISCTRLAIWIDMTDFVSIQSVDVGVLADYAGDVDGWYGVTTIGII